MFLTSSDLLGIVRNSSIETSIYYNVGEPYCCWFLLVVTAWPLLVLIKSNLNLVINQRMCPNCLTLAVTLLTCVTAVAIIMVIVLQALRDRW